MEHYEEKTMMMKLLRLKHNDTKRYEKKNLQKCKICVYF